MGEDDSNDSRSASSLALNATALFIDHVSNSIDHNGHSEEHEGGHSGGGHSAPPYFILFVFIAVAIGALMRHLGKRMPIPYTVLLILVGLGFGAISGNVAAVASYTAIVRIDPHLILFIFLPTLIFESAFAMDVHTFMRCIGQVLILAGPGLLTATFLTGIMAKYLFYDWGWYASLTFGTILSATDPVAVVALLKDLGASKILGTIIEGESLLNDGVAIVVFNVFLNGMIPGEEMSVSEVFVYFLRVALGGPALGYVMARVTVFWLSHVFNDALVEITITLASTYTTFYIGEVVLGVSGVLAVVVLGVEINSRRTEISPDVETFLHHFWEMMAYLANTLIFFIVGVAISESAFDGIVAQDWMYLLATYFGISIIRLVVIWIFSPALMRVGYGLPWRNGLIMVWGGLRGAVGLSMAMLVSQREELDVGDFMSTTGNKILFHCAGIVVMTLVINATTVKGLLNMLGMSAISESKRLMMAGAVRRVIERQNQTMEMLKMDRFLSDSNWLIVKDFVQIQDPYYIHEVEEDPESLTFIAKESLRQKLATQDTKRLMTPTEVAELAEDSRLRFLKAEKTSYWKQYEDGILGRNAVRVLNQAADQAMDVGDRLVTSDDLKQYWTLPNWLMRIASYLGDYMGKVAKEPRIPLPHDVLGRFMHAVVSHNAFSYSILSIIGLNTIVIAMELAANEGSGLEKAVRYMNFVFTTVYILESVAKLIGMRRYYFKQYWNCFDFFIVIISIVDIIISETTRNAENSTDTNAIREVGRVLRIGRAGRILRLFRLVIPTVRNGINLALNRRLSFGYDVGIGYVVAQEEVCKLMDHIVSNPVIMTELKRRSDEGRLSVLKALGMLRRDHPDVAISVKTRQAIRSVLNQGRDTVRELHEDGLLDETDADRLAMIIEVNIKRVQNAPPSMAEPQPEEMLRAVSWLNGMDSEVCDFIVNAAQVKCYEEGELIVRQNDPSDGLYIIISGLVRVSADFDTYHWQDYLGPGSVIGEMGVLAGLPRSANIHAETVATTFFITVEDMNCTLTMCKPLHDRLWHVAGVRLAYIKLMGVSPYRNWAAKKLKLCCEMGEVIQYNLTCVIKLENDVECIVLSGGVVSLVDDVQYEQMAYVPRSVRTLRISMKGTRLLMISRQNNKNNYEELTLDTQSESPLRRVSFLVGPPEYDAEGNDNMEKINENGSEGIKSLASLKGNSELSDCDDFSSQSTPRNSLVYRQKNRKSSHSTIETDLQPPLEENFSQQDINNVDFDTAEHPFSVVSEEQLQEALEHIRRSSLKLNK